MTKKLRILSYFLILTILQACVFLTPTDLPDQQGTDTPAAVTQESFMAETDGPPGFGATLAAPDIVLLSWEAVPDAVGYKVQIVFAGLDPLTIAYLPQDSTSFKHYLASESSVLTYRLQTITASGPAGASSLQITTQAHAPNPLTVQASFAETGAASALIGPGGGMLETTDDHGVSYTLIFPPGALDTELEITMIPVSAIDGWPLDGDFLGGVRLEPEGWLLNEVAYLTIHIPTALNPALATVGFAFNDSGEEFHLTSAYHGRSPIASQGIGGARQASPVLQQDAGTFSLPIMALKPSGIGETSADSAALQAAKYVPTKNSDAADQKSAVTAAALDELAPLLTNLELGEIATSNLVTQIRNVKDCVDFKQGVSSFHAWESKVAQLGDNYGADRYVILKEMAEKAVETIENASGECVNADKGEVPASVPCAEILLHDITADGTAPGSDPFYKDLQNAITSDKGLKDRMSNANLDLKKCPHSFGVFETHLSSRWISSCIPSLNRPYQIGFITPISKGVYWLFPASESDPFSGRLGGNNVLEVDSIKSISIYEGTYVMTDIVKDNNGYPLSMTLKLSYLETVTACVDGKCSVGNGTPVGLGIPLIVLPTSCPIP